MRKLAIILGLITVLSCQHKGSSKGTDRVDPEDSNNPDKPGVVQTCESLSADWRGALKSSRNNAFLAKVFVQQDEAVRDKLLQDYEALKESCKN
jgi:hypothetical protein